MSSSITLKYEGRVRKIRESELCTRLVGKVFSLFPDSIVLVNEDGLVENPSEDGRFDLPVECTEYEVQGDGMGHIQTTSSAAVSLSGAMTPLQPNPVKSGTPKFILKAKKPPATNSTSSAQVAQDEEVNKMVEIHTVIDNELQRKGSFPVTLKKFTANIDYISSVLSIEVFDGAAVVLLDNDNFEIPDTLTTQSNN